MRADVEKEVMAVVVEGGKGNEGRMKRWYEARRVRTKDGENDARKRERGGRNEVRDAKANRERPLSRHWKVYRAIIFCSILT